MAINIMRTYSQSAQEVGAPRTAKPLARPIAKSRCLVADFSNLCIAAKLT